MMLYYFFSSVLIQGGPAVFTMGHRNVTNLFDGYTKLVRVHLSGNNSIYKSRFLMTDNLKASLAMGEVASCMTITEPNPPYTRREKIMAVYRGFDNAYFNVFPFGEDTVSLGEQSMVILSTDKPWRQ